MSPESDSGVLLNFILLLIIASATAFYAHRKGRNPLLWFVIGVLLGILAPVILLFLAAVKNDDNQEGQHPPKIENLEEGEKNSKELVENRLEIENEIENIVWYYLDQSHEQRGPVSLIALRDLWNRGELTLESFVWSEGMEQWQRIDHLPSLHQALNQH